MNSNLEINGHHFELFIEHKRIKTRIREMARAYNRDLLTGKTMVPVMVGAFYFSGQFLEHIDKPYRLISVQAASYQGVYRSNKVRISFLKEDHLIRDAHLVILEDIIDSGFTAYELEKYFYERGAAEVEVISLFYKPDQQKHKCNLTHYGFSVGSEFLIGFGLDLDEEGRHLKDVYRQVTKDK